MVRYNISSVNRRTGEKDDQSDSVIGRGAAGQLTRQIRALHASEDRQKRYATVRLWDRSTEAVDNSVENHGRREPKCRGLLTLLVFD